MRLTRIELAKIAEAATTATKTLTKSTHVVFDQGTFDSKSVYDKA